MKDKNLREEVDALVQARKDNPPKSALREQVDAIVQEGRNVGDIVGRISRNADAFNAALANKGYEKAKADTKKMLEESTLNADPYPTSEDVQKEQLQRFMDERANEARARGVQEYLDSTIGAWSADRVNSVVDDWTDSRAQNMRRNAERVSRAKAEGVIPEGGVAKLEVPAIDVQLPKSVTEANIVADRQRADIMAKGSLLKKVSFADLSGKSQEEASKIVKDYLAENPHMEANKEMLEGYVANNIYNNTFKWKLDNDEQFFADAFEATHGIKYKDFLKKRVNEIKGIIKDLRDEAGDVAYDESHNRAINDLMSDTRGELRIPALEGYMGEKLAEKPYDEMLDKLNNWEKNNFASGVAAGFDWSDILSMGLADLLSTAEMGNVLEKANRGAKLYGNEERLYELAKLIQELDSYRDKVYEPQGVMSKIGEGVGTTLEMLPEFALAMTGTGMIGSYAKLGGKAALKAALKAGGKELFKYGVKTTGKLGYNFGLAKVRGLAAAPFMPSTYNTYLDNLNSAYSFDDQGNLTFTPVDKKQAALGAWFSTANEISSEYLGAGIGTVVGWGARGLGRMVAGTKLAAAAVGVGKKARKYLPKFTPQAKVAMRTLGVQADPVSETLSEALGDIMTSYEQTWIGMDVDKSQYGTMDYWMTLAGVTLAYGGTIATMGAAQSYRDVKKAVKAREDILGQITDRSLHDALVAISTSYDVVMASAALADMNWEAYGEEANLARAYVAADLNVKILEGAVEEESRLDRFRGTIEGVRNIVYQGKAGEYSDIIREAEMDGKKVYIINGYEANTNQYIVVDAATGEKTSVDKSKVTVTRELDVDTYIQEAYKNTFSLEAEKQRVADVKTKALQLDNPTEKDVKRVASTLNIALPKVGNTVMLANGNMGAVTEVLSPTEYAVQDPSGATYKVHFTDILSTDKLTATAQGALARGEVAAPIAPVEEATQPTEVSETTTEVAETTAPDDNGITIGAEVIVDGRVGKVRARTQDGKYAVAFEAESGNYEDTEVEFFTGEELASLMGIAPMPTAEAPEVAETAPTEVATTEDGSVDIEQMSAEDAAKALIQRAGTIEEAIAQVKQVIETVTEERKKAAKAEKKASLNDIGKKSAELQALDTRLEFFGEVLGMLEAMLAEQQKQNMTEAQNIAEEAGVAPETTEAVDTTTEENTPVEMPTSGLVRNGAEMKFTDNVIKMVDFVAKRLGITVEFVDGLKNEAGQPVNGDITGKRVRISTSGQKGIKFIMGHEFFHRMKDLVDAQTYADFVNSIKEYAGEKQWNVEVARKRNVYRNHNAQVAKEAMAEMTIEDVAKIAARLNVNIEGLSLDDAKDAVARGAAMSKEAGVAEVDAIFPKMLSYDDVLMVEECAADVAGGLVTNTKTFAKYVEDNSSNIALVRGIRKAIRAMREFFDSFGYTDQQRKLNTLEKSLANVLNEAAKNEAKAEKKPTTEGKTRNSLIGEVGATALDMAEEATIRMDNLTIARQMEERGDTALDIRMATGWERGADGLWRYEVMDAEVNLYDGNEATIRKQIAVAEEEEKDFMQQSKADTKELRERTNTYLAEMREKYGVAEGEETDAMTEEEIAHLQSLTGKEIAFEDYKERRRSELYNRRMALEAQLGYVKVKNTDSDAMIQTTRLGHILQGKNADALFTAYPSLRDMEVQFVTDIRDGAFAAYATKGGYKRIELNAKKTPVDMLTYYLMHEVQHAIQDVEGFAGGGNLSSLHNDGEVTAKEAYDYYRKIAGEVEARNVSARLNMSAEERLNTLLSETEDVAREDQIFLRDGVEMAMAKNAVLPKEEYAKLASTIMTRQHTYGRPSFDYAFTFDNFYVYDYLGDGDSIVNFAMPIIGNEELINNITISIDNGTITDARGLDLYAENLQGKQRTDYRRFADAFKKRHGNRGYGVTFGGDSASNGGAYLENSERVGGDATTRGASGNIDESANQGLNIRHSLITPEMDADYLSAVERGDMETAQQMVMEAAKLAGYSNDESWRKTHRAPRKEEDNVNPFNTEELVPADFWTHPEWYTQIRHNSTDRESYSVLKPAIDKYKQLVAEGKQEEADAITVTMYRGVDKRANSKEASFRNGDWITPSREYAKMSAPYGNTRVIKQDVPLKSIWWDGNSINEWGYDDGSEYAYKDTKNNRKLLDPVTYDDNGNVIPLSERFNPEKEDIRYSLQSEEDILFEKKTASLTGLVRDYNIPLPTFFAHTTEEFVRMAQDYLYLTDDEVEANRAEIERKVGAYVPEDEIILINGGAIRGKEQMSGCVRHEFGHDITKKHLWGEVQQTVQALGEDAIKRAHHEFLRGYDYKKIGPEGVVNEIVSYLVETPTIQEINAIFEGRLEVDDYISKLQGIIENRDDLKEKEVYIATLPLAKKNIELQKQQYGAEKENIIVIPRADSSGRGNSISKGGSTPTHSKGLGGTQARSAAHIRRGEGTDAQEITRYHLPDPDPSDVFFDEIPIFDEQGNEVDITSLTSEEAKEILDGKVLQMLEAEYDHNVSEIRREAREARAAVNEAYREAKSKRRKGAKAARTNAARIDEIFGDTPFESLPYEVQALILIATGQAKIYWGDKGNKRGLASELGLTGSTGDRHAYRNIWGGAKKSFNEVVHDWWESLGGQERGIDDQDLRNALISALQSVQSSRDAMQEIINKYDDLAEDRDNTLAEIDRNEEKELYEAKNAYEQHLANFELAEGEERTAYHDRAAQFFGNQSLSRVEDILEELTGEIERNKRKIERLKAENKDVYGTLAEGINKSKEVVLRALERIRMFAGMEEVDLNDVARLINLVKTARSQRQMNNLSAQATALVQRVSIKKAKTNLMRLLSLKLSNTDIIHKMLKESDTWTKGERDAILKHLWKVSRNGLRVSKAVHKDTKEIVDELKSLVNAFRKDELKGLNDEQKTKVIEAKLAEVEKELHPEVVYDSEGNVQDNANLPTDFNAENKHLAKFFFKSYLEMLAKEVEYHNASAELREKIDNKEKTDGANAAVVVARENYLNALNQFNSSLESLMLEGKDKLRDWNAQKEQHEIEIRSMGIRAIGGEKASGQGKASSKMARARARINTTVNAPYWTFETVLEKIDHNSPYKKGKFYTYFMDKWADANDDLINRYAAHMEEIAEVMRKCFPDDAKNILKLKRNPYALYQHIMRKAESTPIRTLTYKEMGENGQMRDAQIVLNVANAMYVIAMWRQPRYQEAMQEKHGITQSDIDALMTNIASVNAGFLDFMDWVNDTFLPSTRLEYDVVYRKMNGGSMPKEINYFPARVAGHKEVDLANIDNGALPTTPSALKDRMSAHIMPQLGMDYFKVLESHIQDMDNWAAYAELTADLNVLLSSDEFRRRCNDYMGGLGGDGGGKGSLYDLFKQTSLIATGMYRGDAGMEALLGQLQKAWATSNIAFRGWTAVKQISSITTGMFDNWAFYKHAGIAATGVGIYHEIKNAMEISPSLRYRWKSGAAGMEALARETQREDGYTVQRGAYEKGKDFIGDAIKILVRAGMTPNAAVDLLACSIIVNSVYETEIARLTGGKREATEEEKRAAVRKAERAFNTTQQSSEGAYLAPVQANPAYGVLTTYMNASFALHRKRMGGIKELWKLATSKQYRRYLKDEFGVDAAKISAKDAFKDILSGVAGELSFAMMGWGLMKVMTVINGWLNEDDDDEDVAAAKQEFFDSWWQSLLNGYLGGSVVSSWINGFDTSLTPAYDEFAKDVNKLTDDKGSAMWEVAMMFSKYYIGIDLESWYKSAAAIENMYEDDERAGAVLMFLNAPDRYVKAFVGDRREGETLDEYTTRVGRTYALFEEIKFDEKGKPVGEGVYENFVPKSRYNDLDKVFEEEYREDMLKKYGGDKGYADYTMADLRHKQICGLLDWNPDATPSEKMVQTEIQDELEYYQKRVAKAIRKRKNWVGSEEDYYDLLMDEQEAKNDLINNYYEYIKQTGLGAY